MRATPTVILASPRELTRRRWKRLLEPDAGVRLLAETRSGGETLESVGLRPRVLLLDDALCEREGVTFVRALHRKSPRTRILVVTRSTRDPLELLAHGARGYLSGTDLPAFLLKAVRAVHKGEAWLPRRMVSRVLDRLARLSARSDAPPD